MEPRHVYTIRMTPEELAIIKKAAKQAGHKHWSGYVRATMVATSARLLARK